MRTLISALAILLVSGCATPPVNREPIAPLIAQPVQIERYLGLWHEAARLPNSFERDCVRATAEYALRDDGLIAVRNTCFRIDGKTRAAVGRARRVDEALGKLRVSFFGPFWGDYWVIARAEDYSWSIVGEPSGRYLWVLTRAERISGAERAAFEGRLRELGYDTVPLIWNAG